MQTDEEEVRSSSLEAATSIEVSHLHRGTTGGFASSVKKASKTAVDVKLLHSGCHSVHL